MTNVATNLAAVAVLRETSDVLREVTDALTKMATAVDTLVARLPDVIEGMNANTNQPPPATNVVGATSAFINHTINDLLAGIGSSSLAGLHQGVDSTNPISTPAQVAARLAHLPDNGSYYVVFRGTEPGVYSTSAEANANVVGVPGSSMEKFHPKSKAIELYAAQYVGGYLRRI